MNTEIIILANGLFPSRRELIERLQSSKMLICCDGAINKLEKIGVEPFAIIGDLDSLGEVKKEQYSKILYYDSNQYTNDLTKAVNWSIDKGFTNITIMGATGEREDHTIGNIFLLLRYASKVNVKMLTDYGTFTPILKTTTFDSYQGQQVSIFASDINTLITTYNLKYPINHESLPELWNGTLNESLADSFKIGLNDNGKAIIYQLY